jgi:hypothetical protein
MSNLDPMHKKPLISCCEETTSFYGVNATLTIGEIKREKNKTVITRRHHHCEE